MKPNKKSYFRLGITIFSSLAVTILFFFLILRFQDISSYIGFILSAIQPVVIGMVFAYLLCPVAKFLERQCRRIKILTPAARLISVLLTILLAFGVLGMFCALILPQLVDSVRSLVEDLPHLLEVQLTRLSTYLESDSEAADTVMQMITSMETSLMSWIKTNLFATVSTVASSVLSIGSALVNLVVSVIVTIYLLLEREHYIAQCRKLFYAVSRNKRFNCVVMETMHQVNQIFSGFDSSAGDLSGV